MSRTAHGIATARAIGLKGMFDPVAQHFLPTLNRRVARALRRQVERGGTAEAAANILTSGLAGHAALRMHAVDRSLTDAVGAGCRQVVILGAGLDTRAWRMAGLSESTVVEVDLPGIQRRKRASLEGLATTAADVAFQPADLSRDDLADVLADSRHDPARPTAWVWEAVAPYLARSAVAATVEGLSQQSAAGSHLIMTFAHPNVAGNRTLTRLLGPVVRAGFAGVGEPLRSTYDDDEITDLLASHGWRDVTVTGSGDWARAAGRARVQDPYAAERLARAVLQ